MVHACRLRKVTELDTQSYRSTVPVLAVLPHAALKVIVAAIRLRVGLEQTRCIVLRLDDDTDTHTHKEVLKAAVSK
jgi:hypothetical protein